MNNKMVAAMFTLAYMAIYTCIMVVSADETDKRMLLESEFEHRFVAMATKLRALEANNTALQSEVQSLKTQLASEGSVYVRWGRTSCSGTKTELVYKGFMAGPHFSKSGGGVNFACMPHDVIWGNYTTGHTSSNGGLYGVEYETAPKVFPNLYNNDAPCAVCRAPRASVLMVPGRSQCYPTWSMEYAGYLVGGQDGAATTELACLDHDPEVLERGGGSDDQCVIHNVEARCGSLPCPPYVDARELTCVICSK